MRKVGKMVRIAVLGLSLFGFGCATTGPGPRHTDDELESAMRRTEDETLARLAASNNSDIAAAANSIARDYVHPLPLTKSDGPGK